jgi:glutathione gamma-glutamylcysteinyltransferase
MASVMTATIYRRPLPDDLVAFSSAEGKRLFREALERGDMEGWFPLAEQFHTQADPAFCGLGSLVVALNALGVDPQRLWKGPWRWFSEELLDCCVSLDHVRARGLTLVEVACLARCNGVRATLTYASDGGVDALRANVAEAARSSGSVVIAGYARGPLGQTGGGHFSPLAGIHRERDAALLLDVARFKYPPHWVPLARLHRAMEAIDPETGRSRGWLVLQRHEKPGGVLLSLACHAAPWPAVAAILDAPLRRWRSESPRTLDEAMAAVAADLASMEPHIVWREPVDKLHAESVQRLRAGLQESPVGRALAPHAGSGAALAAAWVYALSPDWEWGLAPEVGASLRALASVDALDADLRAEITRLREQWMLLRTDGRADP